ncbi:MAG: cation:proton antiporter subunit C [Firmicutes bacterium]|nr:cation:proton antiporter subunit C [Bacillota bacterium]
MNNFLIILENFLAESGIYVLTFILMALGIFGMIVSGNYMKKLMCMNILQVSIIFFFLTFGQKNGATLPVVLEHLLGAESYINPLPHALMLTAIVVSLGTTGVGLALLMKIKDIYGTIEEDEITGKGGSKNE